MDVAAAVAARAMTMEEMEMEMEMEGALGLSNAKPPSLQSPSNQGSNLGLSATEVRTVSNCKKTEEALAQSKQNCKKTEEALAQSKAQSKQEAVPKLPTPTPTRNLTLARLLV